MTKANWKMAAFAALTAAAAAVGGCRSDDMDDDDLDGRADGRSMTEGRPMAAATDDDDDRGVTKRDLAVDQLPAAVTASFRRQFPGATIVEAEQETYADGTVHYEVEYKDAAGKERDVEFAADGELLDDH